MNVFEQYLNGQIDASQLRSDVQNPGVHNPTAQTSSVQGPSVQSPAVESPVQPNLSNDDQWRGAAFDGRRMTTYDRRIDTETHERNNGVNPFSAVSLSNDPVADQMQHDLNRNYGGSNAFSQVSIAEYDPVRAQREHDITNQTGRFEVERPRTFSDVQLPVDQPANPVGPSNGPAPLNDNAQYQMRTLRNEQNVRTDLDYEQHYNPTNQRPLW